MPITVAERRIMLGMPARHKPACGA